MTLRPSPTDVLTPQVTTILRTDEDDACRRLVVQGGGSAQGKRLLEQVSPPDLLSVPVARPEAASAMLAGLWLWHDWLDESHAISQSLHTASGSFWHAMLQSAVFWVKNGENGDFSALNMH